MCNLEILMAVKAPHACVVMRVQNIGPFVGPNEHSDEVGMRGGVYVTNVENVVFNVVVVVGDDANQSDHVVAGYVLGVVFCRGRVWQIREWGHRHRPGWLHACLLHASTSRVCLQALCL